MTEIYSKVKEIIIDKLGVDEAEVVSEASFENDLGADSLDLVELIMEFEKEFNISIPDEYAEKIKTIGDAIAYIEDVIINVEKDNNAVLPHEDDMQMCQPSIRNHETNKIKQK